MDDEKVNRYVAEFDALLREWARRKARKYADEQLRLYKERFGKSSIIEDVDDEDK
jgi:hypothetical protein